MADVTSRRIKGNSNVTLRSVYFGAAEADNFATKKSMATPNRASPTQKKLLQNIVRYKITNAT